MKISDLFHTTGKPPAYTPGTAFMWTDPHISGQLLAIHLSQEADLASRKTPGVEATISFVLNQALPPDSGRTTGRHLDILDLGCGPGLYTEKLAALGHRVTGMDISPSSIAHARESARENHLDITYRCRDYLCLDDEKRYDLVMMIFTDFGVLFPEQREELLDRIHRALKPGGMFIFDVLNTLWAPDPASRRTWEISKEGFWRPGPCLALSETFDYDTGSPDQGLYLSQHIVADDNGIEVYRFYTRTFSHGGLAALLKDHGYRDVCCRSGILPDSEFYGANDVSFCRAVR